MRANSATFWRINNDEAIWQSAQEDAALTHVLPEVIGHCTSKLFKLDTDLSYIETHYLPNRGLSVLSQTPAQNEPRMVLTLGLAGKSRFQDKTGSEIRFNAGYSTITTFNANEGSRHYLGNQSVTQLRFAMTQSWLEKHFGEGAFAAYFKHNNLQIISHQPSAASSLHAAQVLLQNTLPPKAQMLLRQGQAMTIVANELSHLLASNQAQSRYFTFRDKQIAERAREILTIDFKHPPSVEQLSRLVGTNSFKLKQLFHHFFNTTPYRLLLDIRMTKAHQLLSAQQQPINAIAEAVGYQHASNFSTAFTKYFGFAPKQVGRKSGH